MGLATDKGNRRARFNRLFSLAGLAVGGGILAALCVHVGRTADLRALLGQLRPLWLVGGPCACPSARAWTR